MREVSDHVVAAEVGACQRCGRIVHAAWTDRHCAGGRGAEHRSLMTGTAGWCPRCETVVAGEHECVFMVCAVCGVRVGREEWELHRRTTVHCEAEEKWVREEGERKEKKMREEQQEVEKMRILELEKKLREVRTPKSL